MALELSLSECLRFERNRFAASSRDGEVPQGPSGSRQVSTHRPGNSYPAFLYPAIIFPFPVIVATERDGTLVDAIVASRMMLSRPLVRLTGTVATSEPSNSSLFLWGA